MVGLTSSVMLVLALPSLVAHLTTIALTKALQSYSRSRLEEYCADHGKPERAAEVAYLDEATERAAEAIAVVSGLLLAALIGVALDRWHSPPRLELLVLLVLLIGCLGYVLAEVLGKVFAEPIIYSLWPAAFIIRGMAWPLSQGAKGLEYLDEITKRMLAEWHGEWKPRAKRPDDRMAPTSASHFNTRLKGFFRWAVDVADLIENNPAKALPSIQPSDKRTWPLSPEQFEMMEFSE